MRIIPAIDLIDGQCVRLTEGQYESKKVYHNDPLEVAKQFEDAGIKYLHLVDLDGAKAGKVINWRVLERICQHTQLKVDFGGGVKTAEDLRLVFDSGAAQVTGGSIAVYQPDAFLSWLKQYGAERIILGADVKDLKIATHGWQKTSSQDIFDFLNYYQSQGVQYVVCTDISKDGKLAGPANELYKQLRARFPDLKLIASGGISQMQDLEILQNIGVEGSIVGKALYEKKINLKDLQALH